MVKNSPQLSVLMPVYNAERYLAEAVESVLSQTFSDFEFIIIDDGSTDRSLEILQRYAEQDDRIRLVSRPNTGLIGALNEGLALARGELIARMDADDISLPERFSRQLEYLLAHPNCIAIGSRAVMIDPEGAPLCEMSKEATHEEIDAFHLTGRGGALLHAASMIRREILKAVGGYRKEFPDAEDYDLFLRLAEVGRLANLPEPLYRYRQHLASVGYTKRRAQSRSVSAALRETHTRRGLEPPADDLVDVNPPLASKAERHCEWAGWAFEAGNFATARKHALAAVREEPLSKERWKFAIWTIRRSLSAKLRPVSHSSRPPNDCKRAAGFTNEKIG